MQGTTYVAFTVLDVLGYLEEIPVCVGYEIDGNKIDHRFPDNDTSEKKQNRYMKYCRDGTAISEASKHMRSFRKTAENILNLSRKNRIPHHDDLQWSWS